MTRSPALSSTSSCARSSYPHETQRPEAARRRDGDMPSDREGSTPGAWRVAAQAWETEERKSATRGSAAVLGRASHSDGETAKHALLGAATRVAIEAVVERLGIESARWGCDAGENRQGNQSRYYRLHGRIFLRKRSGQHHRNRSLSMRYGELVGLAVLHSTRL